ncbi:hypothetical protein EYF80_061111 [Liparis tanakae]|uniref:Uncharacterized protein n=1 Tax=Liparis tanakae TaxID=230148 RepID=A0A4Z2EJD7_9TELE|nr:hypothetical protein EYF80_061111 [Liparis tanakae]
MEPGEGRNAAFPLRGGVALWWMWSQSSIAPKLDAANFISWAADLNDGAGTGFMEVSTGGINQAGKRDTTLPLLDRAPPPQRPRPLRGSASSGTLGTGALHHSQENNIL